MTRTLRAEPQRTPLHYLNGCAALLTDKPYEHGLWHHRFATITSPKGTTAGASSGILTHDPALMILLIPYSPHSHDSLCHLSIILPVLKSHPFHVPAESEIWRLGGWRDSPRRTPGGPLPAMPEISKANCAAVLVSLTEAACGPSLVGCFCKPTAMPRGDYTSPQRQRLSALGRNSTV